MSTIATDLTARLEQVKQKCREAIELGEKATPGPWWTPDGEMSDCHVFAKGLDGQDYVLANCKGRVVFATSTNPSLDKASAKFIAHSRTFTPSAARAILVAIDAIEKQAVRFKLEGFTPGIDAMNEALTEICNQFDQ